MLASAMGDGDRLELTRLVLALISARATRIPDELVEHFDLVIRQAKHLATKPSDVTPDIDPESIALALSISLKGEFARELQPVDDWRSITPDLAKRLLEQMESASVY